MQQQYQREMETLNKKLRWYAENQDILDKNTDALREKNEEIKRLKETLDKSNTQVKYRSMALGNIHFMNILLRLSVLRALPVVCWTKCWQRE